MTTPVRAAPGRPTDEELSERILVVTAELLARDGLVGLRLEHVARAAHCGKAAIYRRHPDKAALVAAVIRSGLELGAQPDTGSLRDDLLAHALQNQRNQHHHSEGDLRAEHRIRLATFEPEVYSILWDEFLCERHEQALRIIARGIERGELPADTDPDTIVDAIAGLTLFRQSIKGIPVPDAHYLALIDGLIAHPPRRVRTADDRIHTP